MPDDSGVLLEIVLHAADIANPVMPADISMRWAKAVQEEFTMQVAEERKFGIPVSAFMDGLQEPLKAAKSQLGFIDFVIAPMFNPFFTLCDGLSEPRANLAQNREQVV